MSDIISPAPVSDSNPQQLITQMQASAFQLGQVATRLLADHPDLPMCGVTLHLFVADRINAATLDICAPQIADVHAWAEVFQAQAEVRVVSSTPRPFEFAEFQAETDGVTVKVIATRTLTADEAAALTDAEATS